MSIRAHSQPSALSQCPAPPLLVSVKPRKCGKNQEKRLICINLESGNPGAAELGLQGWGAAFFGGGYPKKISSFPGEALLAAHLFPGKAGLGGSGWAQNIPKKKKKTELDSPGRFSWRFPALCHGNRALPRDREPENAKFLGQQAPVFHPHGKTSGMGGSGRGVRWDLGRAQSRTHHALN